MTQIILDRPTLERLRAPNDIVEVCDDAGNVIGTFLPVIEPIDESTAEPQLDLAELRCRAAEPGGRPLNQILVDLKQQP